MKNESRILLVEDDKSMGFLLTTLLEEEGYSVEYCSDGETGLNRYKPNAFDLCILDVMMPKMDGFELISKLKANERYRDIPVIVFSANTTPQFQEQAIASGAAYFLKKPSPTDLILSTIHGVLDRS